MRKKVFFCLVLYMIILGPFVSLATPRFINVIKQSNSGLSHNPGLNENVSIEAFIDGDTITFSSNNYEGVLFFTIADANNIERIAGLYDVEEGEEYEIDLSGLWESDYTITFTLDDGTEYEGTFHY